MSNGEHEIRTPKGLRIGNRSVVDGKNMLQIKRGGCEDYISAESLVECIHGLPVKSIEFFTAENQRKQECDRRISEVQEQIEQFKAEESVQSVVPGTVRAAAEQAGNFLNGTRLTASMVSAFVENVFVYGGGRIVVRFKYEQSIQDTVKALHTD